ncbi:ferritin family protein [Clostridium sp. UBA4548]|uniref:ferritin family protein n=1 Tax=Clostridium sp. UBA4548 TaxID=1946361 RepID=UPI0025BD525B|nr:ferritin family protein [Clostridium sp. UBA4548]
MDIKELQILKQAIINEVEGAEFYKLAAAKEGIAEEVKNEFLSLAEEEVKHITWLKTLFEKIKDDKEDDFNLSIIEPLPSPRIFRWDNLDRESATIAVSVFGIAIQTEKAAVEFYENSAKNTSIKQAKELYKILASWEKQHLEIFSREYENLLDQWWSQQSYAPF